ncbi:MAG: membrane integrity-associated transporter subunit PqiC [Altererythrobacter sp.]|nr:membrane integrity-associated transporter subunit PqiC [Altererythrobacter sp.]OJU59654.1 MAG: ABC transporter [Altererythrobacter sp. 66-12]
MLKRALLPATLAMALAGCISLAPKPPEQLITLTPARMASPGSDVAGPATSVLAVVEPTAEQRLSVTRVPVQVSDSGVAYLKDAVWVEKPTRLFQQLLAETIRARGARLVVGEGGLGYSAATTLSGRLLDIGYDAATSSVIVRYDAVLQMPDGNVRTRRFESRVPGIAPDVTAVGPALNQAANQVAAEVAEWVG